jgi:hypothetical protein
MRPEVRNILKPILGSAGIDDRYGFLLTFMTPLLRAILGADVVNI